MRTLLGLAVGIGSASGLSGEAHAADLVVWHAYRGDEARAIEAAAEAWGGSAEVEVQVVAIPFGAFDAKVETAIPRGNGPDLFISGHGNIGKWRSMDLLQPWTDPLDDHRPATVEAVFSGGQAWGVPLAFKSVVLLYDPTVIDEVPTTTDELIRAGEGPHRGRTLRPGVPGRRALLPRRLAARLRRHRRIRPRRPGPRRSPGVLPAAWRSTRGSSPPNPPLSSSPACTARATPPS